MGKLFMRLDQGKLISFPTFMSFCLVVSRQRNDQIRKLEHRRVKENMERRRKNSERVHRFYAAKDEETDSDTDEEEDEVLDFHKQKSEVIFWNDPRIR